MIVDYKEKYKNIMQSMKRKKNHVRFKNKVEEFKNHADSTIFDISTCKCLMCSCEKDRKIPKRERTFLPDQRTSEKRQSEE